MNLNKQLELAQAIFGRDQQTGLERVSGTATADSSDGTVTVEFEDGSAIEVPVTGAVKSGDEVIVDIQNGTPIAAGAAGWGDRVQTIADAASTAASQAQAVAEATGQHFWHRSTDPNGDGAGTGAFITDEEQDDFLTAAASGFADYDPSTKPYRNVLMNSLGFLIREALHNLASFTQSAVSFFDGSGNVTASFGSGGAVVGMVADGESRTEIATSGLHVYQRVNGADTSIADLGYGLGNDGGGGTANAPYYSLGTRMGQIGNWSVAEGYGNTASHYASHAEGYATNATGFASHAEGQYSLASGEYAHAEGYYTKATNDECHAEGSFSEANGMFSHAQNLYTLANGRFQTAIGKYNIADTDPVGEYALIIGNGTADNARSNALTVAWTGAVEAAGDVTANGTKLTGYAVTRFVPNTTSAQTLSTSAALVTSITTKELDTAGVTVSSNVYTLPSAGLWRITAHMGMYPNTTAKTRMSAGIYQNNASGTRLAIGIHEVYNLTANTASQVTTVMAQTVINAAANDKIAICAFADVTNAKLHKSDSSITNITFEKVG